MIIPLAQPLLALFERAARRAAAVPRAIALDDLLTALAGHAELGERLGRALSPQDGWREAPDAQPPVEMAVFVDDRPVCFDRDSQRIVLDGAKAVILGPYEPRHLAEAIGAAAEMYPERFSRFGFDSRAWRRALQVRIEDH